MPDVDLSPAAYAAGKFPPGCSSKDFVLIDQAEFQVSLGLSDANLAFMPMHCCSLSLVAHACHRPAVTIFAANVCHCTASRAFGCVSAGTLHKAMHGRNIETLLYMYMAQHSCSKPLLEV